MKRWHSVLIFLVLLVSGIVASVGSYNAASKRVEHDLGEALSLALKVQKSTVITPDTMAVFRENIPVAELRKSSRIVVRAGDNDRLTYSAECSVAAVWGISDQRLAMLFASCAMLWGIICVSFNIKRFGTQCDDCGLFLNEDNGMFYDADGKEVAFTPMQRQLMTLFFNSADHQLSKSEICNALWPKKEDASETLYTLIRRLKPVVEKHSNMQIESLRGRAYRLTPRK
ncbi:helix-turn-helix domain-containing protein [Prevotella sp. OH937_COT-195]|uniref:helix-turn-helix domain-containing protein n=1 Tax=Prevotella sp. OH937_COT-195 TaxID=2491051 RepID=UPI000F645517|nr:helix-turn-helix domain-containing protein [Prevotella sp. OH937_COT-195]RRD02276.1 helix-turn-helix domain-containing protein [Prevotella sp. OH937_COT-195]